MTVFVLLMAFAAGTVDAIAGGGGLISVPAFLSAGVPPALLLGTNKSMAMLGTCVSVIRYGRAGLVPRLSLRRWGGLVLLAVAGGAVGALFSQLPWIVGNLRLLVPVLLLGVLIFLVHRWVQEGREARGPVQVSPDLVLRRPISAAVVTLISGYDGVFGPGTGTFFLSYFERQGVSTVAGNAITKVFNLSSNFGALLVFAVSEKVDWRLGLSAAAAYMAGNYLGSGLVLKRGKGLVRATVLVMTTLMLLKLVLFK